MNKFILIILGLLSVSRLEATIYRVGYTGYPVAGIDFGYNNLQGACDAAANNDTIQIYQQTATTTNSATLYKPLRIIGFGHTLNNNSGLQAVNKVDSSNNHTYLSMQQGSEGTMVEGLNLDHVDLYVGNITITRCRFRRGIQNEGFVPCYGGGNLFGPHSNYTGINLHIGYYGDLPNITVSDCFFDGFNDGHPIQVSNWNSANKATNLLINNNYFNDQLLLKTGTSGQVSGIFANNIINHKFRKLVNINNWNSNICTEGNFYAAGNYMHTEFDQFLIKNNIFNTADTVTWPINAEMSIVQNNIFSCASQYAGYTQGSVNNIFKANMTAVFGPLWNDGLVYNDNQLALGTSSPAINAGIKYNNTATDCGIFGGETDQDYKLSGIPNVPAFYQIATPGVNANTSPYNVTISVRSNK